MSYKSSRSGACLLVLSHLLSLLPVLSICQPHGPSFSSKSPSRWLPAQDICARCSLWSRSPRSSCGCFFVSIEVSAPGLPRRGVLLESQFHKSGLILSGLSDSPKVTRQTREPKLDSPPLLTVPLTVQPDLIRTCSRMFPSPCSRITYGP